MRKTLRWLLRVMLAGLFVAASTGLARNQEGNQTVPVNNKTKNQLHQQEAQNQRHRLKENRKSVQAEARRTEHPGTPPKAARHQMKKIQNHPSLKTANLRLARKENRSHHSAQHKSQTN